MSRAKAEADGETAAGDDFCDLQFVNYHWRTINNKHAEWRFFSSDNLSLNVKSIIYVFPAAPLSAGKTSISDKSFEPKNAMTRFYLDEVDENRPNKLQPCKFIPKMKLAFE